MLFYRDGFKIRLFFMKNLLIAVFLCSFFLCYGEKNTAPQSKKDELKTGAKQSQTDQSPKTRKLTNKSKKETKNDQNKNKALQTTKSQPNKSAGKNKTKPETAKLKTKATSQTSKSADKKRVKAKTKKQKQRKANKTSKKQKAKSQKAEGKDQTKQKETALKEKPSPAEKPPGAVTLKIKEVFEDFLEILETKSIADTEYKKAVHFLERSLYNSASFETLKILSTVYADKKDFKNQINALKILTASYPEQSESFYLLGMAYKNLYLNKEENKEENKKKSIENINQALKINPKYTLAYEALLSLLMTKNEKTEEALHTTESLSVARDMLKKLRKKKYYITLCQAYYDNNFLKQSQKACAKSVKLNPHDPASALTEVLSQTDEKNKNKKLLKVSEKFKDSFFAQYKIARYFMDKDPKAAIIHFDKAYALQPEHLKLNQIMAKFFFENKAEGKSYQHFVNVCRMTKGRSLKDFRKAKSALHRKQKVDLILKFQKAIEECFIQAKKSRSSPN